MSQKPITPEKGSLPWQQQDTKEEDSTTQAPQDVEAADQGADESESTPDAAPSTSDIPDEAQSQLTLKETAAKFLEDPAVHNESPDRKRAFLRSKRVSDEDIESLVGMPISGSEESISAKTEELKSSFKQLSSPPPLATAAPRDIPPIVTYPEFLTQSAQPPPLITIDRILNTAYISGGIAASVYGLSKFIVGPMLDNLTVARHDLASYTQSQLDTLNRRLGDLVSTDPTIAAKTGGQADLEHQDAVSETDSDPTELYHRDFGTQTTPTLSRRDSVSSTSSDMSTLETATSRQSGKLKSLVTQLEELNNMTSTGSSAEDSLTGQLRELSSYLNNMRFQQSSYYGGGSLYGGNFGTKSDKNRQEDAVDALKSEIRSVKGVFLSAKNFPTGGRGMGRVGS